MSIQCSLGVILIHISLNAHLDIFFYEVPIQVLFLHFFFFFAVLHRIQDLVSPPGNKPVPYSGSVGVLTTGASGKSPVQVFVQFSVGLFVFV